MCETGTDLVYEELPLKRKLEPVLQKMKEHKENQNLLGKEVKKNGVCPHFPKDNVIKEVTPWYGAAKSGLRINNKLISVDGIELKDLSGYEAIITCRGEVGSKTYEVFIWRRS